MSELISFQGNENNDKKTIYIQIKKILKKLYFVLNYFIHLLNKK